MVISHHQDNKDTGYSNILIKMMINEIGEDHDDDGNEALISIRSVQYFTLYICVVHGIYMVHVTDA